jgi:hypothetical protein
LAVTDGARARTGEATTASASSALPGKYLCMVRLSGWVASVRL